LSFLGYIFAPARGPVIYMPEPSAPAGFFQQLVHESVAACGGPHGAFPSLHVGAACFMLLSDFGRDRLRAYTYAPLVAGIAAATIVTGYHYLIDVPAGALIALAAHRLAARGALDQAFQEKPHDL